MAQRYYSQVYWHFTGGPRIPANLRVTRPREAVGAERPLKDPEEAFHIALRILKDRKLEARSKEYWGEVTSDQFACVTDIPLKDLTSHASYYGQTAIGFHHEAIHREWSPVLYVPPREATLLEALVLAINVVIETDAGGRLPSSNNESVVNYDPDINKEPILRIMRRDNPDLAETEIREQYAQMVQIFAQHAQLEEDARLQVIQPFTRNVHRKLLNLVKVTEFGVEPGESFYQEREWRHIGDFTFKAQDVTALVVPSHLVGSAKRHLEELDLMEVSVIGWDVIEHG